MSNKLKRLVDPIAGEHQWYVAGGCAAWWHIAGFISQNDPNNDYFRRVKRTIFPGDVEGGAAVAVNTEMDGKFGRLGVELSETAGSKLNEIIETHCIDLDGVYFYRIQSIILRYATASSESKAHKRGLRVGMLKCIQGGVTINAANVNRLKGGGGLFSGGFGGKLRKTGKDLL